MDFSELNIKKGMFLMERLRYDIFNDLIKHLYRYGYVSLNGSEDVKLEKNILNNEHMLNEPLLDKKLLKTKPFLVTLSPEKYNDISDVRHWGYCVFTTCLKEMVKQNNEYIKKYVLMYCNPKPVVKDGKIKTISTNLILISPIYADNISEDIKHDLYINDSLFLMQVSIAFRDIYFQKGRPVGAYMIAPPINVLREIDGKIMYMSDKYTEEEKDISKYVICIDKDTNVNTPKCIMIDEGRML